ncbi:hypothetical protein FOZ62_006865, partial [Perkinsus olseni]
MASCTSSGNFTAVIGRLIVSGPDARLNDNHLGYRGRALSIQLRGQGLRPDGNDSIILRPDAEGYRGCPEGTDSEIEKSFGPVGSTLSSHPYDAHHGRRDIEVYHQQRLDASPGSYHICWSTATTAARLEGGGLPNTVSSRLYRAGHDEQLSCGADSDASSQMPESWPCEDRIRTRSQCAPTVARNARFSPSALIETCAAESVLRGAADDWYSLPGVPASSRPATNGGQAFHWRSEHAGDYLLSRVDEYTMCSSFPQPIEGRLPCSLVVDYQAVAGTLIVAKPLGCSEATPHNDDCFLQIPRSFVSGEGLALLRTETSTCDDYTVEDAEELAGILLASRMELDAGSTNTLSSSWHQAFHSPTSLNASNLTKGTYKLCQIVDDGHHLRELSVVYDRLSPLGKLKVGYGGQAMMASQIPQELRKFIICPRFSRWQPSTRTCDCLPGYHPVPESPSAGPTSHHCEPCPLGYYCPGEGEKRPCAPGLTTASTGAAYVEDCMCAPGRYLGAGSAPTCLPCPRGTYKSDVANHSACHRGCFNREGLAAPIEGSTSEPGATGPLDCRCEEGYILSYAAGGERDSAPLTCIRCPLGMICQRAGKALEGRIPMAVSYELLGMDDPEMVGGSENEGTNTATEKIMSVLSDLLCRAAVREGGATCFLEGVSARLPRRSLTTTLGGRRLLDTEPAIEVTARVVVSARVAAAVETSSVDGLEELTARLRDTSEDGVFDGLERITPLTTAPNTTAQELFQWFAGVDGGLLVSCPVGSLVPTGKAATSIQDCECGPGWALVARRPSGGPLCDRCGFGSYRAGVSDTPNATCTSCSRNMVTRIDTAPSSEYCICRPGYYWDPELDACGRCPVGDICTEHPLNAPPPPPAIRTLARWYGSALDHQWHREISRHPTRIPCPSGMTRLGGTSYFEIATVAEALAYPASDASVLESCECAPGRKHVPIGDVLLEEGREKIRKYYKLRIVTGNGKGLAPYVEEDTVQILSTQGCSSSVDATTAEAVPVEAWRQHFDDVSVTIVWGLSAPGASAGCVRMARTVLGGPLGDGSVFSPWWARGYVELLGWTSYHCETSIAPCAYNWTPLGLWTYDKIKETLGRASSASDLRLPLLLKIGSDENSNTTMNGTLSSPSPGGNMRAVVVDSSSRVCEMCESGRIKSSISNADSCRESCPANSESNPGAMSGRDCYCSRGNYRDVVTERLLTGDYTDTSILVCKPCSSLVPGSPEVAQCPGRDLPISMPNYYIVPQRVASGGIFGAKKFTPYGFDDANSSDGRYRSPVVEACVVEEDLDIPSIRPPTTCKAHGQCLEGMRGFMCGACASGYWRDDVEKSCEECDTSWWARALYYLNIPWFLLVDSAQAVVIAKFTADAADDESRPIHSVIIKILGNYFVAIAPLGRFDFSKLKRYSRNPGMSTEVNIPSWSRAFFRKLIAVKDIVPEIKVESSIMCILQDSPRQHIVEATLWLLSPLFKIVFLTLVCGTLILMHKHLWRILMAIRGLRVKKDRTIKIVSKKIRRSLTRRRSSTASFSTRRSSLASLVPQSVDEVDVSSVDSSISEPTPIDVEALAAKQGGCPRGSSRLLGIWRTDYPTQSESPPRRALRTLCGFVNDSTPVYLVTAFYSWQRVTEKMLLLLQCHTFSDTMRGQHVQRLRWMTDPDVLCFEGSPHSTLVTIAVLGLTTWTIGFVLLSMTLLFNNRKVLMEDHCLRKYGFLYLGFEIRCWYWESVKRVQAFLYGLITNISLGDMKAKLVCYAVLSGVSCILHVSVLPYDDREKGLLDALEAKSLFSIFITHVTIQLILMFDLADEVVVFMILLCGFMNAAFIVQAIYHLLKEYAFYYVRKREKRIAEAEEARQESLRRRAIKEIKRSRRMARKRLERFISLGGTLDESAVRKAEDDSIIVDEKDIAEWIEQRRGLRPAAGSEENVQEKRPMPSSLLATIKDLWARYYPPDAIMRYVKRLEDMKSRMGLRMEKPTGSIGQTAEMPIITTLLIPKTPKNMVDRVRYALGGEQSTGGEQDLVHFATEFFWTIQAETVAHITGRLEEASGGVENRSSLLDAGAYDFAMRVLLAYAHRLRKQDKPHLWGPDDAVRRVEEMRLGLRQFSLGRVSSLGSRAPLSPITEENGDGEQEWEPSCGSFDVRNDLTLGELIVLPL